MYKHRQHIDMQPISIPELKGDAFYRKIEADHFYMVGDNRDNSSDSRFWGSVPYSHIVGKPWLIYMSLEFRSYARVFEGQNGSGKDHDKLRRICPNMDIASKTCETLWNKQRYTVRWGRVGRRIDSIQLEAPIE
jgi:signal peptidase I